MRPSGRAPDQLRTITFEPGFTKHAEGSCLVSFGDTRVLVTASVEEKVPPFLRGKGQGWVTAEYGMLPRHPHPRQPRGREGQAIGPDAGDSAADRPLPARRRRFAQARRTPDHGRLRRYPGRWRHAYRRHFRRLGRAPFGGQFAQAGKRPDREAGRGGRLRHPRRPGRARPRLCRRQRRRLRRQFRADLGRCHRRGPGHGRGECYDEEGLLRLLRLARIGCDQIFQAQLQAVGR